MFGELDDSNIYESFDAFSDNNDGNNSSAEFSFGDSGDTQNEPSNDDFLDMSSYSEPSEMPQQDVLAGGSDSFVQPSVSDNKGMDDLNFEEQQSQPQVQQPAKKSGGGFFVLLLLILAVAAGGLFYYKKFMAPAPSQDSAAGDYFYDQAAQQGAEPTVPEAANTATVDVNLADNGAADAAKVALDDKDLEKKEAEQLAADQDKLENDKSLSPKERADLKKKIDSEKNKLDFASKKVIVPVAAGGRVDPFLPYNEKVALVNAPKFDLIPPPSEVPVADPVVDQVTQTKISGIMYDSSRPSAIVNIAGSDYLVHKGDNVNGFQILNITKNSVTIKYNANIYQATVGEEIGGNVQLNPVSNIANQFGGAYKKPPKNAIQF